MLFPIALLHTVIVSISTIALYVSYGIPILVGYCARKNGTWRQKGPWNLGRHSNWINLLSLAWVLILCVLFVVPPNELTGYTMGGSLVVLIILYFTATKNWKAPHPKV